MQTNARRAPPPPAAPVLAFQCQGRVRGRRKSMPLRFHPGGVVVRSQVWSLRHPWKTQQSLFSPFRTVAQMNANQPTPNRRDRPHNPRHPLQSDSRPPCHRPLSSAVGAASICLTRSCTPLPRHRPFKCNGQWHVKSHSVPPAMCSFCIHNFAARESSLPILTCLSDYSE